MTIPDYINPLADPLVTYAIEHLGAVVRRVVDVNTGEILQQRAGAGTDVRSTAARAGLRGLSNVHILTRSIPQAKLVYWEGGGLVKVCKPMRSLQTHEPVKRGVITTMSRAARRRLMYKLGTIQRDAVPVFMTLTYPGLYEGDVKMCKAHLESVRRRFERAGVAAVWRLEYKERRSGASEGEAVPHFHMMVWLPEGLTLAAFQRWIAKAWYEVVGSGSLDHFKAGTSTEVMRSWRGVMWYSAKYISKEDTSALPAGVGRLWGVINETSIPWAEMKEVAITDGQCRIAISVFESMVGYEMRDSCPSMTVLVDSAEHWRNMVLQM